MDAAAGFSSISSFQRINKVDPSLESPAAVNDRGGVDDDDDVDGGGVGGRNSIKGDQYEGR